MAPQSAPADILHNGALPWNLRFANAFGAVPLQFGYAACHIGLRQYHGGHIDTVRAEVL